MVSLLYSVQFYPILSFRLDVCQRCQDEKAHCLGIYVCGKYSILPCYLLQNFGCYNVQVFLCRGLPVVFAVVFKLYQPRASLDLYNRMPLTTFCSDFSGLWLAQLDAGLVLFLGSVDGKNGVTDM